MWSRSRSLKNAAVNAYWTKLQQDIMRSVSLELRYTVSKIQSE